MGEIFQQCKAESERKKSRDGATRSHDVCKEKVGISPRPALTTTIGSSGNDGTTDSAPGGGSLIPVDEARFVPSRNNISPLTNSSVGPNNRQQLQALESHPH